MGQIIAWGSLEAYPLSFPLNNQIKDISVDNTIYNSTEDKAEIPSLDRDSGMRSLSITLCILYKLIANGKTA